MPDPLADTDLIDLDTGDTIELTATHLIRDHGNEFWSGVKIVGTIRVGESPYAAAQRIDSALQNLSIRVTGSTLNTARHN